MKRQTALWMLLMMILQFLVPASALAEGEPYALQITVYGETKYVRTYDGEYKGNRYLSLIDLASALSGTEKQFRFERVISSSDGEYFAVNMQLAPLTASGAAGYPNQTNPVGLYLFRNRLLIDGAERKYYTYNPQNGDLYMSLTDIQLLLNITVSPSGHGGLIFDLGRPFLPDLQTLREQGYFAGMNGIYLADATSGEVLFQQNSRVPVPIASLTKLLSYLILKEAIGAGEISADDMVIISQQAEALSRTPDGIITLHAGREVPLRELVEAMLVASSNECALALAEHLCGSEDVFVARMQARAEELGLSSARLYNCHGLPSYTEGNVPVKRQNYMSAEDLFRLSQLILLKYPEIANTTSAQLAHFPSLDDYWTANSNPLVFNMAGVTGLKTGHTNQAGYCVAVSLPVATSQETHTVVLILLGAESADLRGQAAEILLRAARVQIGV